MREALAERLLAEVMGWTPEDIARERPDLQAMAAYKYDEYQQFSPGMRFIESLASWLGQLEDPEQRIVAYEFVKRRMLFCSSGEINHFVSMAYPDFIRSYLMRRTAEEISVDPRHIARIGASAEFRLRERRCLYLGLSDGARTDVFRRHNATDLSPEQIRQTHELSDERIENLLKSLKKDLHAITGADPDPALCSFKTLVLLDDFSASGLSYLRRTGDGNIEGKIGNLYQAVKNTDKAFARLLDPGGVEIVVVLYMATEQAREHLNRISSEIWADVGVSWRLEVVNPLSPSVTIRPGVGDPMEPIIEAHYDDANETEHTWLGGTDLKYGFAACGLPLVLTHNTPNNSVALLWAKSDLMRPLFPRVTRHKAEA